MTYTLAVVELGRGASAFLGAVSGGLLVLLIWWVAWRIYDRFFG